jgi:hypothetical protein
MRIVRLRLLAPIVVLALAAGCGFLKSPRSGIDENLFLLHALEETYRSWPNSDTSSQDEIAQWLTRTRARITQLRASLRTQNLDPDVGSLYDDCLSFLDAYEAYLTNVGMINRQIKSREATDLAWSIFTGLRQGNEAERRALRRGESEDAAGWSGLGAAIFGGFGEGIERGEDRRRDRQAAVAAEQRSLRATLTTTMANATAVAEKLTGKYDWAPGEAGLDDSKGKTLRDELEKRPRDPFVLVRIARRRSEGDTPARLLEKADLCVKALDLVPQGSMFDPFRADFLKEAANLGVSATVQELQPFAYSLGPAPSGPQAVRLCELYLAADPGDPSGGGHMLLSHSLASAGRYNDAVDAANVAREKWDNDANFRYRYAKLMSLTHSLDLAGDWLEHSYRAGFNNIDYVRNDSDLANYRSGRPEEYTRLTSVKWSFTIVWDILLDDIVLTNDSPFELTNARVDVFVRQGSRTWEPVISRASLKPEESYKAHDVMSVPGGRYDEATAVMFCDQDP